jgi:hypothetical protein
MADNKSPCPMVLALENIGTLNDSLFTAFEIRSR